MEGVKGIKKALVLLLRKEYKPEPLICPKCQGEIWFDKLTTLRNSKGIISFFDQTGRDQKIFQHFGLWEESHGPP
jgi:hypothetical protein